MMSLIVSAMLKSPFSSNGQRNRVERRNARYRSVVEERRRWLIPDTYGKPKLQFICNIGARMNTWLIEKILNFLFIR
jgi:hypothetical protein